MKVNILGGNLTYRRGEYSIDRRGEYLTYRRGEGQHWGWVGPPLHHLDVSKWKNVPALKKSTFGRIKKFSTCDSPGQLPAASHPHPPPPPSATLKDFGLEKQKKVFEVEKRRKVFGVEKQEKVFGVEKQKMRQVDSPVKNPRKSDVPFSEKYWWMMVMRMFLFIALRSTINAYYQNWVLLIKLSERAKISKLGCY